MKNLLAILIVLFFFSCVNDEPQKVSNIFSQKTLEQKLTTKKKKFLDINPYYYYSYDLELDSNYVEYWCSIDILTKTEKKITSLDGNMVAYFLATFHKNCNNNAEFTQWSNELLFQVLNNNTKDFVDIISKNFTLQRNYILNELRSPINDGISPKLIIDKVKELETTYCDDWKWKIIEALENKPFSNYKKEDIYGIWTIDNEGPHADMSIDEESYFVVDYDGDGNMPYTFKNDTLTVQFPESEITGYIEKVTSDSLVIIWGNDDRTIYVKWTN